MYHLPQSGGLCVPLWWSILTVNFPKITSTRTLVKDKSTNVHEDNSRENYFQGEVLPDQCYSITLEQIKYKGKRKYGNKLSFRSPATITSADISSSHTPHNRPKHLKYWENQPFLYFSSIYVLCCLGYSQWP